MAKHEDTETFRKRLLDVSVALVEERGLDALSLREVARRAGVSHQTPYHHFRDREAILAAIAAQGFDELGAQLETANGEAGAAGTAQLLLAGKAYVAFALARPAHFRLMFRPEHVDLRQHPDALAAGQRAHRALEAAVRACVRDKTVRRADQADAINLTWALAHGLASLLLDGPLGLSLTSTEDREVAADRAFRLFRRLVEARGS
jgi:AcrR family transcriptional regulator